MSRTSSNRWRRRRPPVEQRLQRAIAEHKAGRLDRAATLYEALLREDPELATVHAMRGLLAHQRGEHADAIAALDRALAIDPAAAGTHLNRGNVLRALGRLDDAVLAYTRALELDDGLMIAHNNLGNALRDRGQLDEAVAAYRNALDRDPSSFAAASNLAHTLARLDTVPAQELVAAQRHAIALAEGQGIRSAHRANCHNALAGLLKAGGEVDEAVREFERAIEIDPTFTEAHVNLARLLVADCRLDAALMPWRRAIELAPAELESHRQLALTLRRLGRNDEAAAAYRACLEQQPGDAFAEHMLRSLAGGDPPERASDEFVRAEFDDFAANFDRNLARLEYRAPELVVEALARAATREHATGLDAGCGTGLCGPLLRSMAHTLVGVDLSEGMLARARERGSYDELVQAELTAYLDSHPTAFDFAVASDVLIYFGALELVVRAFRRALRAPGTLAFSVECGRNEARGYELLPAGRYAHHEDYLRRTLAAEGFEVREIEQACLRYELGAEVLGWVVVATT